MQLIVTYHMCICTLCSIQKQTFKRACGTIREVDTLREGYMGGVIFKMIYIQTLYDFYNFTHQIKSDFYAAL